MIEGSAAASDLTWGGMVQLSGANGKGIQTSSGELIVPTYKYIAYLNRTMKHTASSGQGQVLRSSDSGSTWSLGYDVRPLLHPGPQRLDVGPDSGEGQLVQLYDNATLFYELRVDTAMPCEDPAVPHCRLTALSDDGGLTCVQQPSAPPTPA